MGRKNASGSETWMETGIPTRPQASHMGSNRGSSTFTSGPVVRFSRRKRPSVFRTFRPRAPAFFALSIASACFCGKPGSFRRAHDGSV